MIHSSGCFQYACTWPASSTCHVQPVAARATANEAARATALRAKLQRFPFHAASKAALGFRGVPIGPEVRAPLRALTEAERAEVERIVEGWPTPGK